LTAVFLLAPVSMALADEIKIGAIFSATGRVSFIGDPEKKTVEMLVERINKSGGVLGKKLNVIIYDSESNTNKAVTAANRLLKSDKVVAAIGPSLSGNSMAVKPLFEKAGIPLFSAAASDKIVKPVSKWIFKSAQANSLAVQKILQHAKAKGYKNIAIMSVSNGFGQNGREALQKLIPKSGMKMVADEVFGPKDTDMTAQLTKIRELKPDAIICWGTNPGPAVVARNAKQLGIKQQIYMSHGVASQKFIKLAEGSAEGILLPAGRLIVAEQLPDSNKQKKLLLAYKKDFESKYGGKVSTFGGHGYDALLLVIEAIKRGRSAEPADIQKNLEKIQGWVGTAGIFNLGPRDHNGLDASSFAMVKVENGAFKLAE